MQDSDSLVESELELTIPQEVFRIKNYNLSSVK